MPYRGFFWQQTGVARLDGGLMARFVREQLSAFAVSAALLWPGFPTAGEQASPDWKRIREQAEKIRNVYANSSWDIDDMSRSAMREDPQRFRVVWSVPNMKVEKLSPSGELVYAAVVGPELQFVAVREADARAATLLEVGARSESLFFEPPAPGMIVKGDRHRGGPMFYCWRDALRLAELAEAVADPAMLTTKGSDPEGEFVLSAKLIKSGEDEICRVQFLDPLSKLLHGGDFRPDLSWALARYWQESARLSGEAIRTIAEVRKLPPENRRRFFGTHPRNVTERTYSYNGQLESVPRVVEFKELGWRKEAPEVVNVLAHIQIVTAKAKSSTVAEFLPEHYGVAYSRPRSYPWRWVAGIVGALGVVAGFWWLRRRAAAS